MTDQERLNRLMAEMRGFVDGPVKGWYFKNHYDGEFIKDWNPWGDIGQAMECLHAWIDKHPDYDYALGSDFDTPEHFGASSDCTTYLELFVPGNECFTGLAEPKHESTAIVKALEAAVKGEE